jgi:hypothetical protein
VPDGRVRAVLDDFVLSDGTRMRVRIESDGPSMLVTFLGQADEPLPGSPIELTQDFSESVGPNSIVGYWAPAVGVRIAEHAGHDGLLRVFVIHGSSAGRFFQYARSDVSLDLTSAGHGVLNDGTEWRLDSGSPYRGGFASTELEASGMLDGPGTAPDFDPFAAVRQHNEGDEAAEMPRSAIFTLRHEFETLPYAGGVLLGSVMWGYTMTWTLSDGVATGPVPKSITPVLRPPEHTKSLMPDNLGTSWNPRVKRAG